MRPVVAFKAVVAIACGLALLSGVAAPRASGAASPMFSPVPGSPFPAAGGAWGVAFSPSGRWLAYADESGTTLARVALTGELSPASSAPAPAALEFPRTAFSPDGTLVATTDLDASAVSVDSVSAAGVLTPVPGSPFGVGGRPQDLAFSPDGQELAVLTSGGEVAMFDTSSTGSLSPVSGSPFAVGGSGASLAFSPGGGLLAVTTDTQTAPGVVQGSLSTFTVAATGQLSSGPVTSVPLAADAGAVGFAPSGQLLAVTDISAGTVAMYSVATAGGLTAVPGSPVLTGGSQPGALAFSPSGQLLAVANNNLNGTGVIPDYSNLTVYSVSTDGALTPVSGSPFTTGPGPNAVAFSPNGLLIATADLNRGQISVSAAAPFATITTPAAGARYPLGRRVAVRFACQENPLGPGIASCTPSQAGRLLDTARPGRHTFTVTATSRDGLSTTATASYTVQPSRPRSIERPVIHGRPRVGGRLSCTRGRWTGHPTGFRYGWRRGVEPIAHASASTYVVRARDRGTDLACTVTATNSSGRATIAQSAPVRIPRAR